MRIKIDGIVFECQPGTRSFRGGGITCTCEFSQAGFAYWVARLDGTTLNSGKHRRSVKTAIRALRAKLPR